MAEFSLFDSEEKVVKRARAILDEIKNQDDPVCSEFSTLLAGYDKLYRKLRRLIKVSDKQQQKLNELNEKLDARNQLIKKTFGQYLSDDIVKTILESSEGAALGGEKRRATILMSDLRGFTPVSERLPAESVVNILNHYLETMTDIIFKYQGTIDEFIGDAILVIFGAPYKREDDPLRAVACALEMQLAMTEVNRWNLENGYPEIEMGVGINTGDVVVGNIGSTKRTKYAVVGSNVNLTSRIESCTLGGQVFISQTTRDACGDILRIDNSFEVMPKGIEKPITIYEVGGVGGKYLITLPLKEAVALSKLPEALPIKFYVISGKRARGKEFVGKILGYCRKHADIEVNTDIELFSNLKLSVLDNKHNPFASDLYAKVMEEISPNVFRIHFTYFPEGTKEALNKLIEFGMKEKKKGINKGEQRES